MSEQSIDAVPSPLPPPPPPRKSRSGIFLVGALSGCLVVTTGFVFLFVLIAVYGSDSGELSLSTEKVAIVPIEGEILEARETLDLLQKYAKNPNVKAIVIRINSPGGAIAPSQEIYSAIRMTRKKTGKPIVASMDSVAASGGYYIAAACERVVANPGSITGSIGVILEWMNTKDLVQWAKIKPETITSGSLKAAGSPYRDLTPAERDYFQHIVSQLHSQFVRAVAEGRSGKLTEAEVAKMADGRVFTGEEALSLKLIDELGTIDDAARAAAKSAGIKGEPVKIWPKRREIGLLDLLTGSDAETLIQRMVSRRLPRFLYRW